MKDLNLQYEELKTLYEQRGEEEDTTAKRLLAAEESRFASSQWRVIWHKFIRNRAAIIGGAVILLFYLGAVFADFITPYDLETRMVQYAYMPPQRVHFFADGMFRPFVYGITGERHPVTLKKVYRENTAEKIPVRFFVRGYPYKLFGLVPMNVHLFGVKESGIFLLGTDGQGRDMFSRVILGSQISLSIGLVGVFLSLIIGAILGVASGYFGGWADQVIQRLIEVVRSFPSIPLWMALTAALPNHWSPLKVYFTISVILSLIGWTWLARQLRGKVLTLREEDFVMAAQLAGASHTWIILRHLIPATLSHIIVIGTLAMPSMILAESALSFLGLGIRPPLTSWGSLLQEAQNIQALVLYPWLLIPGVFVAASILAFNFLGDGLRDAADPYTL